MKWNGPSKTKRGSKPKERVVLKTSRELKQKDGTEECILDSENVFEDISDADDEPDQMKFENVNELENPVDVNLNKEDECIIENQALNNQNDGSPNENSCSSNRETSITDSKASNRKENDAVCPDFWHCK